MKKIFGTMFFLFALVAPACAGQQSRLELKNGNTLDGEILSFSDGKYTVKSPVLGVFKIEDSQIRAIHRLDAMPAVPDAGVVIPANLPENSEAQKIQSAITGNPNVMAALPALFANSEFQELIKDPEVARAARASDVDALIANPKVASLINNPEVREIGRKVQEESL